MKPKTVSDTLQPWITLAAATGVNLSMGLNYSWSVIQKGLIAEWHWTNLQASLPYTAYAVIITLAMLLCGRLQSSRGPKFSIRTGAVLMGLGLILCSFSRQPVLIAVAYSIAGCGAGICYSTTLPTVIRWFPPERKGFVTGIVISGSGLAPVYVSVIADQVLACYGIANTFLSLGVGIFTLLLIMVQFLDSPPAGYVFPAAASAEVSSCKRAEYSEADLSWREMLQTPLFFKLWLMYLFASSAGLMIIGHITIIAKTQANWDRGFYLVILIAVFNTLGRVAAGYFSDRYGIMTIIRGMFLLMAIDLFSFINYTSPVLLAVGVAILAFCYGTCPAIFPLATAEYFGIKNLGTNYGVLFTAWGSAALIGPVLAGKTVDLTATYFYAYIVSAVLILIAFVLATTIKPAANEEIAWEE